MRGGRRRGPGRDGECGRGRSRRRVQRASPTRCLAIAALAALLMLASAARAEQDPTPPDAVDEITVTGRRGLSATASSQVAIPRQDFELLPLESGGQLLEVVPGLLTAQHTGGGKAEQYFVRGFDADHGTDLRVTFDGVPVNLRSHAHGQGFLDLHFVIPETIREIEVSKGPYLPENGDFDTAAAVHYVPFRRVDESILRVEAGQFDTIRGVAVGSPRTGAFAERLDALVAIETYTTDGPFLSEEDLHRTSLYASLGGDLDGPLGSRWRLEGSLVGYLAEWNASGLIPDSLVDDRVISRWGSLDDSEGGDTARVHALARARGEDLAGFDVLAEVWAAYYQLDLYSNFTYFLNDPVRGDGIVQRDDRTYFGGRAELARDLELLFPLRVTVGTDTRTDLARVELGRQERRAQFATTAEDEIRESSVAGYVRLDAQPLPWVRAVVGLRGEHFRFDVENRLGDGDEGVEDESIVLPKANLVASPFAARGPLASVGERWEALRALDLFANFGVGFHSNDARDVLANPGERTLPKALGWEVGLQTRLFGRLDLAASYWWLELQSEFVFVGDEGVTERRPRSEREGLEVSARLRVFDWLTWTADVAYTQAHFADSGLPVEQAPRFVAKSSLVARHPSGLAGHVRVKALGERYGDPASDFDIRLSDYAIVDVGASYRWGPVSLGVLVENLLDSEWSSSEFFYESRPFPAGPVIADRHFSPGNKRNVRGTLTVAF